MSYARHIKNGRLTPYAAAANARTERRLRAGLICAACGREFGERVKRAEKPHADLCQECANAID